MINLIGRQNCFVCNEKQKNWHCRHNLLTVSNEILLKIHYDQKTILKCNTRICKSCHRKYIKTKKGCILTRKHMANIAVYDPKIHIVPGKYWNMLYANNKKLDKKVQKQHKQIHDLQQQNKELRNKIVRSLKGKHWRECKGDYDYDAEISRIPEGEGSGKTKQNVWKNRIQYELMAESDCLTFSGFNRSTIIKQARIAECYPEWVFHLRTWIYRYMPRKLHASMFGLSTWRLSKWIFETLTKMRRKYAKTVLVNDQPGQYYTRKIIHDNCPKFVYKVRHIEDPFGANHDKNVITIDSTYQFVQSIQTNHFIRKHTTNMHKHTTLLKIHIWCCANGQPIYAQYIYGDGYHADGKAFASAMSRDHLQQCKQALIDYKKKPSEENKEKLDKCSFTNMKVISEIENLQELINILDHIICDNGYRLRDKHPGLKMPAAQPLKGDEGGQVTCAAAAHKRGIMCVRNTHERVNGYVKRHTFCRSKIHTMDMRHVPAVWDICLADMIHENIVLAKDTDRTEELANRIIDLERVLINPVNIHWVDKKVKKANRDLSQPSLKDINKNQKKDLVETILDEDYCLICCDKYKSATWNQHKQTQKHTQERNKWII